MPEDLAGGLYALRDHFDLFEIILLLKEKPDVSRSVLITEHFSNYGADHTPDIRDQLRAFDLAIRVLTMVNCSLENPCSIPWKLGPEPIVWRSDYSLSKFMKSNFPTKDRSSLSEKDGSLELKRKLAAKQLKKVLGLSFRGTDDLRNHLYLDSETRSVQIYHHTSFLKEHLRATREDHQDHPMSNSVFRYA